MNFTLLIKFSILLIFGISSIINSNPLHNFNYIQKLTNLNSIIEIKHECPRFLFIDIGKYGLGDQLMRLFTLLALSHHLNATAIVNSGFGLSSYHEKNGYMSSFTKLGKYY